MRHGWGENLWVWTIVRETSKTEKLKENGWKKKPQNPRAVGQLQKV